MKVLVLSGGGAKGAFQAGVVKALTEKGHRWDAIAGVSVGSINGSFLAQFRKEDQAEAADKLVEFWNQMKGDGDVFKRWFPFGKLHSLWTGGFYNTSPLLERLKKDLDPNKLANSGVRLLIGAVCLESGEYRYVEGTHPNIHEWVMASSAFPVAFPPVLLDGKHWVDGGVRDTTPISDTLQLNPESIDVVLCGALDSPGTFPAKDSTNVLKGGMRSAELLSDEVFNGDMLQVPEAKRSLLTVYAPPKDAVLSDPLSFDPKSIANMLALGLQVGRNG